MRKPFSKFLMAVIIITVSFENLQGQLSANWLGPDMSGIYKESSLLKVWPSSGPSLIWESNDAGTGFSSASVTDDTVYITGRKGDNDVLSAFGQDGKKLWETIYGKASDSNYPDSRSTPSVSAGKIFVVSGEGDLVCMGKEGKILWSVNYTAKSLTS